MSSKKTIRRIWKNEINYFDTLCEQSNLKRDCSIAEYIKLTTEKGALSCIPVSCNVCKYLATTTNIEILAKRKRVRCFCNRKKGPWSNRWDEFYLECESRNIKPYCTKEEFIDLTTKNGARSFIPLQCNECKEIVRTTTITSFTQGRLGCSCNTSLPWSNRWDEFYLKCESRNIKPYCTKEEFIDLTTENGAHSFIPLQCNECKEIVRTTTIDSFNQENLGCFCNGRKGPWFNRWDEFCRECKSRNVKPCCTEQEFIELTTENGGRSLIPLQCNECKEIVRTTTIVNFVYLGNLGCSCNTSLPWSNRWGEFYLECESRNIKPYCTKEEFIDLTTENGNNCFIPLQCNECKEIVRTTTIASFLRGRVGCSCNTSLPWSNRWDEFYLKCESRNIKPYCTKEEFIDLTTENGVNSFIPLQCNECKEIVMSTTINNFVYHGKLGCKCALGRSEKMCGDILHELFGDKYPFQKVHPDWLKYSEDSRYKGEIDFYCEELKLALEYNGIQHYEYQPNFFHKNGYCIFEYQQEKDKIRRQKCKENGIVLIEVPYTYNHEDKDAMKSFIMNEIEVKTGYEWIFVSYLCET